MEDDFKFGNDIEVHPGESKLRKTNKFKAIVLGIGIALIIGILVFLVSNSIFNPKREENTQVVYKSLDVSDDTVLSLYSYVTYGINNTRGDKFIREQSVDINSFSNYDKFYYALMNASEDDFIDTDSVDSANNKIYTIASSQIDKYMKSFFGPNVKYLNSSVINYAFDFSIDNKNVATMKYNASRNGYDTVFTGVSNREADKTIKPYYTKLSSARSSSDGKLEMNERIIYTDYTESNGVYTINIYKDYQHTMLIDTKEVTSDKLDSLGDLISEYSSNASTITYKFASSDSSYYFVSSSITNQTDYCLQLVFSLNNW